MPGRFIILVGVVVVVVLGNTFGSPESGFGRSVFTSCRHFVKPLKEVNMLEKTKRWTVPARAPYEIKSVGAEFASSELRLLLFLFICLSPVSYTARKHDNPMLLIEVTRYWKSCGLIHLETLASACWILASHCNHSQSELRCLRYFVTERKQRLRRFGYAELCR